MWAGRLRRASEQTDWPQPEHRRRLVQIASLAVAAIERYDRSPALAPTTPAQGSDQEGA
jgi:hypothetical protein